MSSCLMVFHLAFLLIIVFTVYFLQWYLNLYHLAQEAVEVLCFIVLLNMYSVEGLCICKIGRTHLLWWSL